MSARRRPREVPLAGPARPQGALVRDRRLLARRRAVERERGRRRLRAALAALVVLALAAGTDAALHSPLFAARHVVVIGAAETGQEAVLEATGLDRHPPLVDVEPAATARELERLPWVARASVARRWPDTILVRVTERVPVAQVRLSAGGVELLDATGRVLADEPAPRQGLPFLLGVRPLPPGAFLPPAERPLCEVAAALPVSLLGDVVGVARQPGAGAVVRLVGGRSALLGGTSDLPLKFVALATVLERANLNGIVTIDLRVPTSPVLTGAGPAPIVQGSLGG